MIAREAVDYAPSDCFAFLFPDVFRKGYAKRLQHLSPASHPVVESLAQLSIIAISHDALTSLQQA